uniref:Uncharacterized protein n=1 Tax=Fagus sylvatica TaxID=28930 RepID=A0A2N9F1L2_FAGSY
MAEIQHVVSMGERSSDSEEAETQSISISLKARFKTVNEAAEENKKNKSQSQSQSPTPKIQKVIFLLRDTKDFEKYYEPRVVSLGPIHHGKEKYQLGEKYKLLLTSEFVKGSCKGINALYMKIERRIKKLKDCFEEEVIKKYDGDDEGLAWLLFVDGCAILQYMYCATNKDKFNDLSIKNDSVAFADQDLFLLENQVPYCLLKWLMRWSKNKDLKNSIETFIKGYVYVPLPKYHSSIFRCACLSSLSWKQKQAESSHSKQKPRDPTHLLDLLRTSLLDNHQPINPKKQKGQNTWQSYRNVQELRAAGPLDFNMVSEPPLGCWADLPPIMMRPKFLNLIAYEMSLDFKNDFGITSYISFLDSLIDEANDVKLLRKAGVLYNCLGSDEEVAKLFNEIGTDLVPSTEIYSHVRSEIQKHYNNTLRNWIAQVIHDHFSSPWTFIAFFGALLALALTIIQTWYAVHPSSGPCN